MIWDRLVPKTTEALAHLVVDSMQRDGRTFGGAVGNELL